ncbi:MAG: hypothetical protein E3J23_08685 [Candidatus Stahlbacteria bacterium]|nr:MAG: hypothetical protein E3J23_08685 [Candidatus Stahlbacteria bacterium]
MYIDKDLVYSADQAITATAASTVVVNQIKPGGPHRKAYLFVKCSEVFNTLTSLDIIFQTSDDNFSSDTTEVFKVNFLLAVLALDAVLIEIDIPMTIKQYTRFYYAVNGTDPTTGKIYSAIVPDIEKRIV